MDRKVLSSPLFAGMDSGALTQALDCLKASRKSYAKGSAIFLAGQPAEYVGLVLEGSVQVVRDDVLGNRSILANLDEGDVFGETFACAGVPILPVSVLARSDCKVMLLSYRRIITTCPASCSAHSRLIENMMKILAGKNLLLNEKMEALSARSTREKLVAYLLSQSAKSGSRTIRIPFNRQELADYLSVDRSALSREMSKMSREGLLSYQKDTFTLLRLSSKEEE